MCLRPATLLQLFMGLTLLSVTVLSSYPVFGTKRYGRSTAVAPPHVSPWAVSPPMPLHAYQQARAQPHYYPASYYPSDPILTYPDYVDASDYYYPQETSPYSGYPYYPVTSHGAANGNMKYAVYQSPLPYYYNERQQRPAYHYYGYDESSDPVDDIQEEIQEEEREERGESLPIGQETWYEGDLSQQHQSQDSIADVNAAFLQNLILSQMYNDALNSGQIVNHPGLTYSDEDTTGYGDESWGYGEPLRSRHFPDGRYYQHSEEEEEEGEEDEDDDDEEEEEMNSDEDVKELKSLVKKTREDMIRHQQVPSYKTKNVWSEDGTGRATTKPTWNQNQNPKYEFQQQRNVKKDSYQPIWFQNENAPWLQYSWSNGMKRNYGSPVDAIHSNKLVNKKQESSEHGPWIPYQGMTINVSGRKGNTVKLVRPQSTTTNAPVVSTQVPQPSTTAPVAVTSVPHADTTRGQKEVPLLRPASPARHPFNVPQMMTRTHSSSVYDTIKQLLNMERNLSKVQEVEHSRPQKRYVSNEENLVQELNGLKKLSV